MKAFFKFWILIGPLCFFIACKGPYDYSYRVTNQTDAEIKVIYHIYLGEKTLNIKPDSTGTLLMTTHGGESSGGPFFRDVKKDLYQIEIYKNSTLKSKRDYTLNENWVFDKGVYATVVTNNEF
jgi:hypothetical protein